MTVPMQSPGSALTAATQACGNARKLKGQPRNTVKTNPSGSSSKCRQGTLRYLPVSNWLMLHYW
jgi:hypothetical protein